MELEDSREYGGESCSGATVKGYQPGGASYLSPWCPHQDKMIEHTFNEQGELVVRQRDMSPTVYLDHWALRQFSENQKLADRLTEGLNRRNGTLALSWLNVGEFTKMTMKEQARRAENLIESNLPRVFFLEVEPFAVIRREDDMLTGSSPTAPHADLEFLRVFSQLKPTSLELFTAQNLFRVVQDSGLDKRFDHLADTVVGRVEALRNEMDTNPHFRAIINRSASGPQIQRGTRFILREMVRTMLFDKGTKMTRNQAIDLLHTVVPVAYCDLVLLDKHWETQVDRVRSRFNAAGMFVPMGSVFSGKAKGVDRFLAELEAS
jgi:hypothetical protein